MQASWVAQCSQRALALFELIRKIADFDSQVMKALLSAV